MLALWAVTPLSFAVLDAKRRDTVQGTIEAVETAHDVRVARCVLFLRTPLQSSQHRSARALTSRARSKVAARKRHVHLAARSKAKDVSQVQPANLLARIVYVLLPVFFAELEAYRLQVESVLYRCHGVALSTYWTVYPLVLFKRLQSSIAFQADTRRNASSSSPSLPTVGTRGIPPSDWQ